ncbi:alpha/beta fold hydrolase [Actinomadura rayongensis]|uniref:Alpha/beta fold hydrolase n=1 Tax=Actinomadura rayongensis TaxID=1429076 RepID=A0A6I4WDL5_9ACTN|nr:alpha/beta hydrolase [Actinomadura rayongensis]MXQ67828.1 alpha/beta fold hydrolase [Actinomadura rayongensis]
METRTARNGEVEIAYEVFGDAGRPLLLAGGLDAQMIWWADGFCDGLVRGGFQVVRFDYRDAGLSTHFTGRKQAYTRDDMLDDMNAVLDAIGWDSAHILGLSMGAGLAQFAALRSPQRYRTLTLVNGLPMDDAGFGMFRHIRFPGPFRGALRRYGTSRDEQIRMLMNVMRLTEGRFHAFDETWLRETAERCLDRRTPDPLARRRQMATALRDKQKFSLAEIKHPTLVISGLADPLVKPTAGRRLAARIPGARLLTVPDLGHGITPHHWPLITGELDAHAR